MLTHIVVVAGLLHQHFAVGWHVPHSLLHWAEAGGIAIAVVSTLAAALGEVLSMYKRHAKVRVGGGEKCDYHITLQTQRLPVTLPMPTLPIWPRHLDNLSQLPAPAPLLLLLQDPQGLMMMSGLYMALLPDDIVPPG